MFRCDLTGLSCSKARLTEGGVHCEDVHCTFAPEKICKECGKETGSASIICPECLKKLNEEIKKQHNCKRKWSLLPFRQLIDVVKVFEFGKEKHGNDFGWKQAVETDMVQYKDALLRHVIAYTTDQKQDQESGLPHLAHAVANCLILLYGESHAKIQEN